MFQLNLCEGRISLAMYLGGIKECQVRSLFCKKGAT